MKSYKVETNFSLELNRNVFSANFPGCYLVGALIFNALGMHGAYCEVFQLNTCEPYLSIRSSVKCSLVLSSVSEVGRVVTKVLRQLQVGSARAASVPASEFKPRPRNCFFKVQCAPTVAQMTYWTKRKSDPERTFLQYCTASDVDRVFHISSGNVERIFIIQPTSPTSGLSDARKFLLRGIELQRQLRVRNFTFDNRPS